MIINFLWKLEEWDFLKVIKRAEADGVCPCGKTNIRKEYHIIKNVITGCSTWVGSECIKKFPRWVISAILQNALDIQQAVFMGYVENKFGNIQCEFKLHGNCSLIKYSFLLKQNFNYVPISRNEQLIHVYPEYSLSLIVGETYSLSLIPRQSEKRNLYFAFKLCN